MYSKIQIKEIFNKEMYLLLSKERSGELETFCITSYESDTVFFEDVTDPQGEVLKLVVQKDAYIIKPETRKVPTVYYLLIGDQPCHDMRCFISERGIANNG